MSTLFFKNAKNANLLHLPHEIIQFDSALSPIT